MKTNIEIYPAERQGSGAFDGGKITEIKPIPFPHERGGSRRIGPLFYWAWASANGDGVIPMHPHQGFEIMSYVLKGELGHTDTLGTKSRVGEGGAQVMQTGSGVSHQEEMYGDRTEFFQIWFEPFLRQAVGRPPTYADYRSADFPVESAGEGVTVKKIIGDRAPITLVAEATVQELTLDAGASHAFTLPEGNVLAAVAIEGAGEWASEQGGRQAFDRPAFSVLEAVEGDGALTLHAGDGGLRLLVIETPRKVAYPLYA